MNRNFRSTADHLANRNFANRKPYRTAAQKAEARKTARKCKDGTWRSNAPVTYHSGGGS